MVTLASVCQVPRGRIVIGRTPEAIDRQRWVRRLETARLHLAAMTPYARA